MRQQQIAAQLYSFRDYIKTPAGVRDTLRRLRHLGYRAVQLSGSLAPMSEKELLALLRDEGMSAPTSHERAVDLCQDTGRIIARLQALACTHTAYPYPHWLPTGAGEAVALGEELNRVAEKFRRAGITLAYHNHSVEFRRFEGRSMLELIYEHAPLLDGEPDTFWIQKGGADPVAWIEKLAGRIQVLHIKDFGVNAAAEPVMMPIGGGNLDWTRIFAAAANSGVKWYVVEHDGDCPDPFASFGESMKFLQENFIA